MKIKVVRSTQDRRLLSVRAWDPEEERWSATRFRELLAANFEEGDELVLAHWPEFHDVEHLYEGE